MFKLDCKDLLGGSIRLWVFKVTIGTEVELYSFDGGEVDTESRYTSLYLTNIDTKEKIEIPCMYNGYAPNADTLNVHNYIISPKRSRVIEVIRNIATRSAYNDMYEGIPKQYLKLLEQSKPELLI